MATTSIEQVSNGFIVSGNAPGGYKTYCADLTSVGALLAQIYPNPISASALTAVQTDVTAAAAASTAAQAAAAAAQAAPAAAPAAA